MAIEKEVKEWLKSMDKLPLTDIQTNNKLLEQLVEEQKWKNTLSLIWLILVIILGIYIKYNNVVNNIVAAWS